MSLGGFDKDNLFKALNISRINYGPNGYPGHLQTLLYAMIKESGANDAPTIEIARDWDIHVENLFEYSYIPDGNIYKMVTNAIDTLQMK
ncbi:hypothetical protein D3C77_552850 [compost metagenome]